MNVIEKKSEKSENMKKRIGVYVCHCGGNISDYVNVNQVREIAKDEKGVVISKDVVFACADSSQKDIVDDIKEHNLDSIVVASCSPKLHLHTFRNAAIRGGINKFNYTQVNIREQCSWAHSDKPKEATNKAIGLVRGGIRRVAYSEALDTIKITAKKAAVVVGAGVAGMRAAIELSKMGNNVFLIEKDYFVGGRIAQSGELFITNQNGKEIVSRLYNEISREENITLFTGATINAVSGSLGNFSVDIKIKPRYIVENCNEKTLTDAVKNCKVEIPNSFDHNLNNRKAIYKNYDGACPDKFVADKEALKNEKKFLEKYSKAIDLEKKDEIIQVPAGAILVTTGFDSYKPKEEEFGYKSIDNVVTLPEFKTLIENSNGKLKYNNKKIKTIAYIYCVGNRQKKGENKYCSRFCCTSAIHTSILTKEKFKDIQSYHFYRDIRTYGKQEILYEKSSKMGDIYLKFNEKKPPIIEKVGNNTVVKVKDLLTSKKELEVEADLVVLVTGMVPREDNKDISDILKIPIGRDKFFNEIHPKLRPVETVINGEYIAGCCQGPKNITESVKSSLAASAKINALIKKGSIELEPIVARIDENACTWCGKCMEVCDYSAITKIEKNGKMIASINDSICAGCGMCVPVCKSDAVELAQFTDNEITSMIDGFMENVELKEIKEVVEEKKKVKKGVRRFSKVWDSIAKCIAEEAKTIPQIAKELDMESEKITYHLMSMVKYDFVVATGLDDDDEYYYYKMK